jgi:hypothetical protein
MMGAFTPVTDVVLEVNVGMALAEEFVSSTLMRSKERTM